VDEEADQRTAVTAPMRANLARLQNALYEWLVKDEILGDAAFYRVEQWRERGEEYLIDSLLVLVFDGSTLHTILNFGGDTGEFDDLIESFGFFYELGTERKVYKCVGADGVVVFSEEACGRDAKEMNVDPGRAEPSAVTS
jgi:hypothetical protein